MLNYNEFKNKVIDEINGFLPIEYKNLDIRTEYVPKVNGFQEAIIISPNEKGCAIPNIYVNQFYEMYENEGDFEKVMIDIVDFYVKGMAYGKNLREGMEKASSLDNVVLTLINKENNERLLENCPYKSYLDLAIIYRFIMDLPDGSFNSAIVTDNIVEEFELSEDQLFDIAKENTRRLFPPQTEEIGSFFQILTNKKYINGATSILFEENLKDIADKMNSDIYLLPSSIHELIVVPVGDKTAIQLKKIVEEANETVVDPKEVLSNNVYMYSREQRTVNIAI